MNYTFTNLFSPDFEELSRDLLGRELGLTFEAFGPGPDGGIDGRHSSADGVIVLQAKHFVGSRYSTLAARMRKERPSIDRLVSTRYLLATSQTMSPDNKSDLAAIIGPSLRQVDDIVTAGDLNALLRKFPEVEKAHIKLWLSSSAVLDAVIRSAARNYTNISKQEIEAKVLVYAQNPSFKESYDKLESHHVLIISGLAGVGKTTLAEMLAYAYMSEGWEYNAIRSLDDGFAAIVDTKKQIFFFDDFLGKIALDQQMLSARDSELAKFIRRIRTTKNARFILTTRSYILGEACRISEQLSDHRLDVTKYVLDVGAYTRRIKASILYNHLKMAELSVAHIESLVGSGAIPKIVDHANYNPRIIEWMTDIFRLGETSAEDYPKAFLDVLSNPSQLWDTAFRTHIHQRCRHLLFALFFCSEHGVEIRDLRFVFMPLHRHLCEKFHLSSDPKDFDESLKILEGGFIKIRDTQVSFVNPSIRDYLSDYLLDFELLLSFSNIAARANWARAVWRHGKRSITTPSERTQLAIGFANVARLFPKLQYLRPTGRPFQSDQCDLDNSDRIELLLEWFGASEHEEFAHLALEVSCKPVSGFSGWRDGPTLVELARQIRDGDYYEGLPNGNALIAEIEQAVIRLLDEGLAADDLEQISDAIEDARPNVGAEVVQALHKAIRREFNDIESISAEIDSASTLKDHETTLTKFASLANIPLQTLNRSLEVIKQRIEALAEETEEAEAPSFIKGKGKKADVFDDKAMNNFFSSLLEQAFDENTTENPEGI